MEFSSTKGGDELLTQDVSKLPLNFSLAEKGRIHGVFIEEREGGKGQKCPWPIKCPPKT